LKSIAMFVVPFFDRFYSNYLIWGAKSQELYCFFLTF